MTPDADRSSRVPLSLRTAHALPDLRIGAAREVALHEDVDPGRVERLVARLQREGLLRNPPVAAALPEGGYVVLDGANRVSALAQLQIPAIPLQVVDYQDPAVRLDVWRHLIVDRMDVAAALRAAGLRVEPVGRDEAARRLTDREIACYLHTDGGTLAIPLSPDRVLGATLATVVGTYKGTVRIYRVSTEDLAALSEEFGTVGAVVVFPRLDKQDILEIAHAPVKLPTGITRHLIPGRALRVNLPLDALQRPGDLDQKRRWLAELIRQRLMDHSVRHYPEGVFLFDD